LRYMVEVSLKRLVERASDATTITKIPVVAQVICARQGRAGLDVVNYRVRSSRTIR